MNIKILYHPSTNTYEWELYDGPDGIDYFSGYAETLETCFESIISTRAYISTHYQKEVNDG